MSDSKSANGWGGAEAARALTLKGDAESTFVEEEVILVHTAETALVLHSARRAIREGIELNQTTPYSDTVRFCSAKHCPVLRLYTQEKPKKPKIKTFHWTLFEGHSYLRLPR